MLAGAYYLYKRNVAQQPPAAAGRRRAEPEVMWLARARPRCGVGAQVVSGAGCCSTTFTDTDPHTSPATSVS